ncbi:transposable element Tcb1 transposase [Trichonephila clavipes]|nr:transposable element Tcb1 transposase [Trichonephila clavipes]
MMEAGWPTRRVVRQLGRSDCFVRRCWDQWIREMSLQDAFDRSVVEKTAPSGDVHEETGMQRNGTRSVFSDEFRFNLSIDDNRVRVWRPRGGRLIPAFSLQRHTTPIAGVMV